MKHKFVQLSAGQQGSINLKSLNEARLDDGIDFEVVAIADMDRGRVDTLKERYPELLSGAKQYDDFTDLIETEFPSGVDAVLDASHTFFHLRNIDAAHRMIENGHKIRLWESEKSTFLDADIADFYCNEFAKRGIVIMENNIELYSQPKSVMLDDIRKNCTNISSMSFARVGDVRGKCIKTRRNLFKNYSGSWYDKGIHDVCKALFTARTVGFEEPIVNIREAHFDFIEFVTENGKAVYADHEGNIVNDTESGIINDSYAKVNMSISGINTSMVTSFSPIKPDDAHWIGSWLTPEMKKVVKKVSGKEPSLVWEKAHNWHESRSERVVGVGKDGKRITYVTETFGSPFTVREMDGKVDVLYHTSGEYDTRKASWHHHFMRDVLGCLEGGEPLIGTNQIKEETRIMQGVHHAAYKRSIKKGSFYTIDLRDEPELRRIWDSDKSMRV